MAIRYCGTDIIRDYRGYTITKTTGRCNETIYVVKELERDYIHITLKAAKRAVDKYIEIFGEVKK